MDIFDRFMHLKAFRKIEPFYKKHKEPIMYLIFGGIAFFLNIALFFLFNTVIGLNELIANVISWILCVLFQFFTNRTWVFDGRVEGAGRFIGQMASFFGARLVTLGIEEGLLAIFITWLGFNATIVKLLASVIVIILNYIFSKLIVFKKKK